MLTAFLKKLLFARQFSIMEGKVEILGKRQLMLPSDVVEVMGAEISAIHYESVKKAIASDLKDYAKKLGSGEQGMLRNMADIFETFGLGHLQLIKLDNAAKSCIVRISNSPLSKKKAGLDLTGAVLAVWIGCLLFLAALFFAPLRYPI